MDYDVIIIGCGPAGLSAAIYLGRAKVKTLLIGKRKQSQLIKAHNIENYFGFPSGISGKGLLDLGIKQIKKFKVKLIENEVVNASQKKDRFKLKIDNGTEYTSKILILATGTPIKLSGIKNEEEFTGKGVHYCVECDAPFYKGKKVAVIGNGNHAAEDAIDLRVFTKDVTIISNADNFDFSPEMKNSLEKNKVNLVNVKIIEFKGRKFLDTVIVGDNKQIKLDGVFMACNTTSALDFAAELGLQIENNSLVVDKDNMTSVEGIFAAGNCCARCRQVAKNVGDGCNAALSAIKHLRHQEMYVDYSVMKG